MNRRLSHAAAGAMLAALALVACKAEQKAEKTDRIVLATTHTIEDSGLLDSLKAGFKAANPRENLQVVVAGTGEVIRMAISKDVDVMLTHSPGDELGFVSAGNGVSRRPVMHNEFIFVGPTADPAQVKGSRDALVVLKKLRDAQAPFISRGDGSGTDIKEKALWELAFLHPDWSNYTQAGVGMAESLRMADQKEAYTFTDVATFMNLQDQLKLNIVFQGDTLLRNEYAVVVVSHALNGPGGKKFADWVTSPPAQQMIERYGRAKFGRSLFIPDAVKSK